uniref:Uncharacterized protein n=1 Tax=Glossina palpalis gambiensis TaxID=67801 RepID=A0A1B0AQV1_9MUSC
MVITLCYDVVSHNVEGMGISPFIMSYIIMASGSLLVGGFFTVAAGIAIAYDNHNAVLLASLTVAARFGVAISYESGSQYAAELIPTCKSYSKRKRNQSLTIGFECNHETDANRSSYT